MNKHLLLIPFIALLATSCSGGHITTTPVLNAPSAGFSHRHTRQALQTPTEDIPFKASAINLGSLNWLKNTAYGFYAGAPSNIIPVSDNSETAKLFCTRYETTYSNNVWQHTNGYRIALNKPSPDNTFPYGYFLVNDEDYFSLTTEEFKSQVDGIYLYYLNNGTLPTLYDDAYTEGYNQGYNEGEEDGYYSESNKLIPNGMYTGLTIFPRRNYLEDYAQKVMGGQVTPENGQFYLIDTNANYTIEMKWTYNASEKITTFKSYGDLIVGELDWHDVAEGKWNTTWFGKYDAELHHFLDTKNYATNAPIETSFYPEVYLGSTFTGGDANLYFAGGGNAYQMGFADGQTQTVHASETYNNVFTIFTPAFRAVADFFNLNIGPFKVWYFFAIPLIVTLLILVLRLVKH